MRELGDILKDYEDTRTSFKDFSNKGDSNKDTLLEFQHRFVDLKAGQLSTVPVIVALPVQLAA